jgi:hypothetical protein
VSEPGGKTPQAKAGEAIARLALTHGQVLWLMDQLGLRQGVSPSTFNHYVKSLRKLGVPFGKSQGRRHATYGFDELMELTLALLLRVYGTLPGAVIDGLRDFRAELRPIYRRAYFASLDGDYPPAHVCAPGIRRFTVEGLFLDLNIRYSAGRMLGFGPPRALSPFEALSVFAAPVVPSRACLPLNVTAVAAMIVGRSRTVPAMRRRRGVRRMPPG